MLEEIFSCGGERSQLYRSFRDSPRFMTVPLRKLYRKNTFQRRNSGVHAHFYI
jgi:hypothetical protein